MTPSDTPEYENDGLEWLSGASNEPEMCNPRYARIPMMLMVQCGVPVAPEFLPVNGDDVDKVTDSLELIGDLSDYAEMNERLWKTFI